MNPFSRALVGLLEASGAFPGASRLELDEIAVEGCELEIDAGRLLALPRVPMEDLLVIIEGHATRTLGGIRVELGPGAVIGAEALRAEEPTATVEATSAMRIASIPVRRLLELGWGGS